MNNIHLPSVDSTNAYIKNHYKELENNTFVSADYQTEGRGRNNRNWISENGKNLLFSLLILDKDLFKHFKEISIIVAYTILKRLESLGLKNIKIKWPNDIYVNDKKICGILLESITNIEMECLIVGVGINVNEMDFENEYRTIPTSIKKELNKEIIIDDLKRDIYEDLLKCLNNIKDNFNYYPLIKEYDYLVNKEAYYEYEGIKKKIKIIGIDKDYSLSVFINNKTINIDNGEIEL